MDRLGMEEGEPIEHKLVTRAISTAQKRVETHNFEIRKHLLEYDDVMNKQREIVYGMRRQILEGESQEETVLEWIEELAERPARRATRPQDAHPEDWDLGGLNEASTGSSTSACRAGAKLDEVASREALVGLVTGEVERAIGSASRRSAPRCSTALERWIILGLEWDGGGFRGIDSCGGTICCTWTISRKASASGATASATR